MGVYYKVLDKGFVEVIDHMGDDITVVSAQRVSTGNQGSKGPVLDKKLIEFLMKNGHESPFEHVVFTFHIKAPIFVARQWFRHRIGSFNEISLRYTEFNETEYYIPENIRVNHDIDKQKSVLVHDPELLRQLQEIVNEVSQMQIERYKELINKNVQRELQRIILPLNIYTEFYWTVNLRSLFNFLNLRVDSHAQWEIQQYAIAIADCIKGYCPWSYEQFVKYYYTGDILKQKSQ